MLQSVMGCILRYRQQSWRRQDCILLPVAHIIWMPALSRMTVTCIFLCRTAFRPGNCSALLTAGVKG